MALGPSAESCLALTKMRFSELVRVILLEDIRGNTRGKPF